MYPDGIGREPDSAPPPGLDWDLYLGPAPSVPFNRKRFLVTYRWFWDYAGGYITDFESFDAPWSLLAARLEGFLVDTGPFTQHYVARGRVRRQVA